MLIILLCPCSVESHYWDAVDHSVNGSMTFISSSAHACRRVEFSPCARFFLFFLCRKSVQEMQFYVIRLQSLQCTDPRYLFIHPISLMTLMATFIIIGCAAPGGLSIQMVLFLPDCLSGHRRTAARGHMFYYSGQLWLKPRSLASHRLRSNTKSWLWKHQVWVDRVLLEECEVSVCIWCVFPSASNSVREWTCPCDRRHTIKLNLNALPAEGKHFRA